MDLGAATHPGYVRPGNEDGLFASRAHAVFAVADGMGGHEHGELASRLALAAIEERAELLGAATPTDLPTALHETIQAGNAAILAQAGLEPDAGAGMGTTVVLATICGDRLYFAHIGDSRLYLLRGDLFTQLTRDHTRVQMMVDRGEITAEEAAIHPLRHQITRVVGYADDVSPEIASQALEPGDIVLLCTDGLSGAVINERIKRILGDTMSAQAKADALVKAALEEGGPDNITAVVVSYQRPQPLAKVSEPAQPQRHGLPLWQSLLIEVLVAGVLILGGGLLAFRNPEYYISIDDHQSVGLYRRWPLLPMRHVERVAVDEVGELPYEDAKPYIEKFRTKKNQDVAKGIVVSGRDVGVETLKQIAKDTAADTLDRARKALEARNLPAARALLDHARQLNADVDATRQLADQLADAEKAPDVPAK